MVVWMMRRSLASLAGVSPLILIRQGTRQLGSSTRVDAALFSREDLYGILKISSNADAKQVKQAFFAHARVYHPDATSRAASSTQAELCEAERVLLRLPLEPLQQPPPAVERLGRLDERLLLPVDVVTLVEELINRQLIGN